MTLNELIDLLRRQRAAHPELADQPALVVLDVNDGGGDTHESYVPAIDVWASTGGVVVAPRVMRGTSPQVPACDDGYLQTYEAAHHGTSAAAFIEAVAQQMLGEDAIRLVVAYLRAHAAAFDDAVAYEAAEPSLSTRYAYVKQQTARVLADRIERGEWRPRDRHGTNCDKQTDATFPCNCGASRR